MTADTEARAALPALVRAVLLGPTEPAQRLILADALGDLDDPRETRVRAPATALTAIEYPACPRCGGYCSERSGKENRYCPACGWSGPASALLPPLADLAGA